MARPRRDGEPPREVRPAQADRSVRVDAQSRRRPELIWDVKQPGLALSVRPTGKKAWKVVYRHHGRPRWLHLGDVRSIGLADARRLAAQVVLDVMEGKDPAGERKAERTDRHLRRPGGAVCRAARQEAQQVVAAGRRAWSRHLLPRWGKLKASAIARADVRTLMLRIEAPIVANQTLAAASAIFAWAVRQEI